MLIFISWTLVFVQFIILFPLVCLVACSIGGGGMGHAVIGKYTVVLADVIVLEPGYMTLLFVYFAWNAFNCDHTSGSWATSIDQRFC